MAPYTGHYIHWETVLPLLLLVGVVKAEFPKPLNYISNRLGKMDIPPNSTFARAVLGIEEFLEGPIAGTMLEHASNILATGLGHYMEKSNNTVNRECSRHMEMTFSALIKRRTLGASKAGLISLYSLAVVDAMGKPRSGLMDMHLKWLGAYDECINVKARVQDNPATKADQTSHFKGRYCKATLVIGGDPAQPLMIRALTIGLCVPSTCNADDIKAFASTGVNPELKFCTFTPDTAVEEIFGKQCHTDIKISAVKDK